MDHNQKSTALRERLGRLRARNLEFPVENIPRHWFRGRVLMTHLNNSLGLFIGEAERFVLGAVRDSLSDISEEALSAAFDGFLFQERHHAQEHHRLYRALVKQGYDLRLLRSYHRFVVKLLARRLTVPQRLATAAALEHGAACLAAAALERSYLEDSNPTVRDMFLWHSAEEIEHQNIVHGLLDVLRVDERLRREGLYVATCYWLSAWLLGVALLLMQEVRFSGLRMLGELRFVVEDEFCFDVFARAFRGYVRRDLSTSETAAAIAAGFLQDLDLRRRPREAPPAGE